MRSSSLNVLVGARSNAATAALACGSGGDHGPMRATDMFLWMLYLGRFYDDCKRTNGRRGRQPLQVRAL